MNALPPSYLDGFRAGSAPPPALPLRAETPPVVAALFEAQALRRLHPLDAFPRLLENARADRPPGAEDRFRFEWFGLFYQGPEQDSFTVRLRLPGGRLRAFQLAALAETTQELAGGCVRLNAGGGLDVPGVPVRASAGILRRLEAVGLSARQTGGHTVRAVRGGEREGLDGGTGGDIAPVLYPLVGELEQAFAHSRELAALPQGCAVAVRAADEADDQGDDASHGGTIIFRRAPAAGTGEGPEFRLVLPGCGDLGFVLAAAQVAPVCLALLRVWSARGDRSDRTRATLARFGAGLGCEGWREGLAREFGEPLESAPAPMPSAGPLPTAEGVPVPGGRLLSGQLAALGQLAAAAGGEARVLPPGQVVVPGVPDAAVERGMRDEG